MRKAFKVALGVVLIGLVILIIGVIANVIQGLLVSGVRFVNQLGDTQIIDDYTPIGGEEIVNPYLNEQPQTTVAPGDDPSWGEEMPEAPVEWPEEAGK